MPWQYDAPILPFPHLEITFEASVHLIAIYLSPVVLRKGAQYILVPYRLSGHFLYKIAIAV